MTDHLTQDMRKWNMSRIRSKDTSPELIVRKMLTLLGVRYRLHRIELPGKPDVVIRKINTIIFVNGCFWHKHQNCKRSSLPKTNTDYWLPKLARNVERQKLVINELKEQGWTVLIIWECETKNIDYLYKKLRNIESMLPK
jgi:DNA mismatch endonuclease (patch repair protein)